MKKLIVASSNKGKIREIQEILGSEYNVVGCNDAGFTGDIEETGKTFYENALIKAMTVAKKLGVPVISDDSGLCVNALSGEPGLFSARYSPEGTDKSNRELLLSNMKNITDRSAEFVCTMVYYDPADGKTFTATGKTDGEILYAPQGENGFGYDPIFLPDGYDQTFGEMPQELKNRISHRAAAFKMALNFVEDEMSVLDDDFDL